MKAEDKKDKEEGHSFSPGAEVDQWSTTHTSAADWERTIDSTHFYLFYNFWEGPALK